MRLLGGFLVMAFIVVVVGGMGLWNITSTNGAVENVIAEDLSLLVKAKNLEAMALTHRRYEKDFFLNIGDPKKQQNYLENFRDISQKTDAQLAQIESSAGGNKRIPDELKAVIKSSRTSYKSYASGFIALSEEILADPTVTPQEANKMMGPIKDSIYQFEEGVTALAAGVEQMMDDVSRDLVAQGKRSQMMITVFLSVGIAISLVMGFLISRAIINPINVLTAGLRDIAQGEGDLTMRLDANRNDEIGNQAKWFNVFIEKIQDIIKEVSQGVDSLTTSSRDLTDVSSQLDANARDTSRRSEEVAVAAERMSSNMNSVSAAMEQSSSNVGMVAAATEEMTSTVNEIARNAARAKGISEDAVEKSTQASGKMSQLGDAADKIGKVTEVITEISEQTNLLALNATIEAARAGEAGKGFAVVANEIKELARQTAEATVDIKNQIGDMQTTTSGTIADIETIGKVIDEINDVITTIASAVEEQSAATSEISGNISQASSGISEVNENVAQSTVSSDHITKEINVINSSSETIKNDSKHVSESAAQLSKLANQLDAIVKRFKIV
jgi:methyl-accepting chemotaxis protein